MSRFLFFTKTDSREPPRLRHQLARLLVSAGHEVIFFQRPRYPWQTSKPARIDGGIHFQQHEELIHHKLRIASPLRSANAGWVKRSIAAAGENLGFRADDVVVNFNYDYWFLRELFPSNRLITVINDDYISRALFGYVEPLAAALRLTCERSDHVLTVSAPLQRQLQEFCDPKLFLPWANDAYQRPQQAADRDTLLFWGYLNRKIDFPFVIRLAKALAKSSERVRMLFVGPIESHESELDSLRSQPGIEILPESSLDALRLERVFAGFIPYRERDPEIDVITWPNKALQLLARGLPLVIKGMPEFFAAPFVFRMTDRAAPEEVIVARTRFNDLQNEIERFVASNNANARLEQFMGFAR